MTVGRISNINYIPAIENMKAPAARHAPQNVQPAAFVASPAAKPAHASSSFFLNLDGDSAEISGRALSLSFAEPNPHSAGPGIISNYRFDLPSPLINWDDINFKQSFIPTSVDPPGSAPPPPAGTPTTGTADGPIPEVADSGSLEELEPQGACVTCQNRKYVDKSDDPSVSFQTPTSINPNMAAAAVASHEQEHVRNEQARAHREDREIISQTVTLTYDGCPECGRSYVSGGTTRTTSVSKSDSSEITGEATAPEDSLEL
jgi:hypothetical protein